MKKIDDYNKEIEKVNAEYAAYEARKQKELGEIASRLEVIRQEERQKKNAHQAKIETLQRERDAAALEIKLSQFPEKLVKNHKFCSVCNSAMRPFVTADGKFWACQNGNLRIDHDLVKVE